MLTQMVGVTFLAYVWLAGTESMIPWLHVIGWADEQNGIRLMSFVNVDPRRDCYLRFLWFKVKLLTNHPGNQPNSPN